MRLFILPHSCPILCPTECPPHTIKIHLDYTLIRAFWKHRMPVLMTTIMSDEEEGSIQPLQRFARCVQQVLDVPIRHRVGEEGGFELRGRQIDAALQHPPEEGRERRRVARLRGV